MTKRKTAKVNETNKEPDKLYVILQPALYKVMIPEEYEFIDPADEKYKDQPPIRTLEHLGEVDINRLIMRRLVAEYVPEEAKEVKGE